MNLDSGALHKLHNSPAGFGEQPRGNDPQGAPRRAADSTPTLFKQLKRLPWAQIPVGHRTRERGHGRRETRTVKAVTVATPGGIAFPHALQAGRITRTGIIAAHTSRETASITSAT